MRAHLPAVLQLRSNTASVEPPAGTRASPASASVEELRSEDRSRSLGADSDSESAEKQVVAVGTSIGVLDLKVFMP